MHNLAKAESAADVVRYLYLARIAEREGHAAAARRLRTTAAGWIEKHFPAARDTSGCAGKRAGPTEIVT